MRSQYYSATFLSLSSLLVISEPSLAFNFYLPPLSSSCTSTSSYCLSNSKTIPNVGTVTTSVKPITKLPPGGTKSLQQILQSSVWATVQAPFQKWSFVPGGSLTGSFDVGLYVPQVFYDPFTSKQSVFTELTVLYNPNTNPNAGSLDPIGSNVHWIQLVRSNYAVQVSLSGVKVLGFGVREVKIDVVTEQTFPTRQDFNPFYDTYGNYSGNNYFYDSPTRDVIFNGINWTAELYLVEEYAPRQVRIYNGIQWGWTTNVVTQQPAKPPSKALPSKGPKSPSDPNRVCPPGMPTGSCIAFGYLDNSSANVLIDSSLLSFDEPSAPTVTPTNSQPDIDNTATVPEPSSMIGVLAVGAWAGISWRKRRNQQSESELVAASNS